MTDQPNSSHSDFLERIARELWQIEVDDDDEPGPAAYEPWAHEWRARAERLLRVIEESR